MHNRDTASPRQILKQIQKAQASKERVHLFKEIGSSGLKALTVASIVLAYTFEGNAAAFTSNISHSLSFILEHVIDYYSDAEARKAYKDSKDEFTNYNRSERGSDITIVSESRGQAKTYGLAEKEESLSIVLKSISIALNAGGSLFTLLDHYGKGSPYTKWFGLGLKVTTVGFHWVHQHYRQHNLKHEKELYDAGIKDIAKVAILEEDRPAPKPRHIR